MTIILVTHNNRSIELRWDFFISPPYDDNPKFRVKEIGIHRNDYHTNLGNFSGLKANIKLVRRVSYYVIRIYAPTFLTTIASFVGFWVPVLAWPGRVLLS